MTTTKFYSTDGLSALELSLTKDNCVFFDITDADDSIMPFLSIPVEDAKLMVKVISELIKMADDNG